MISPIMVLLRFMFEGVFVDQLSEHFQQHLSTYMYVPGFREGCDCQNFEYALVSRISDT